MNIVKFFCIALLIFSVLSALFACNPNQPSAFLIDPARSTPSSILRPGVTVSSTEQQLAQVNVPALDPRDLAIRLRRDVAEVPLVVNSTTPDYAVGDRINFWVLNVNTQEARQITAELIHKTAVAYAWVERPSYNRQVIIQTVEQFSRQSYPAEVAFFGSEWKPGVDNDPRLHILHTTGLGDVGGYFGSADGYSRLVNPYSNEKEMFYINLADLGDGALLAHEFQHMIHSQHDGNEATWVEEGLSEYAQEVAGFGATTALVGDFLNQPDTPLTAWEEGTRNHYGASYLFMKYLRQRFGAAFLRTLVAQPANGVAGIQQALAQQGISQEFDALFADWVVANYANQPDALGQEGLYGYREFPFRKPNAAPLNAPYPVTPVQATVNNYATDYIRLQGEGKVTVQFAGQTTTQLVELPAYSGRYAWWSNQGDGSDSRLTRRFDLRSVAPGTPLAMTVAMWWDIEDHYDYGYVLASRDGRKWDILPSQQTTTDNPTGHSFGPAYTGEKVAAAAASTRWALEQFDLSAYAGQPIWVRFEYVTDDAVNQTGWFIDDVRIPALDYATDFEHGADGWEAEGWLLTDNHLTQRWLLQVLEFEGNALVNLRRVEVDDAGKALVDIANLGDRQTAVLAISALAAVTTEPGVYELAVRQVGDE